MTQSTRTIRTVSDIRAAIAVINGLIDDVDAFQGELNVAYMGQTDFYVVGFDWGMFLTATKSAYLGGVLVARKFASKTVAADYIVRNRKGEIARVMRFAEALEITSEMQAKQMVTLHGMLTDLQDELCGAQAAEIRREAEIAEMDAAWAASVAEYHDHLDREAAKAAYEDEHRRKGPWSLRA